MAVLFTIKAFGQFLPDANTTLYSGAETYSLLASAEKFLVSGRGSQISANTSVIIAIEHSNDGMNWTQKSTPINAAAVTTLLPNAFGADSGTTPGGQFHRVSVKLNTATTAAFIEVWVTGRSND